MTEPVSVIVDGDWMSADGTTLGADNGIAVAMMLAVLENDEIIHPYLECIFTSDEEVGLIGANEIDISGLRSRRLLNLDSEDEGVFTAGCSISASAGFGEAIPEQRSISEAQTAMSLWQECSALSTMLILLT